LITVNSRENGGIEVCHGIYFVCKVVDEDVLGLSWVDLEVCIVIWGLTAVKGDVIIGQIGGEEHFLLGDSKGNHRAVRINSPIVPVQRFDKRLACFTIIFATNEVKNLVVEDILRHLPIVVVHEPVSDECLHVCLPNEEL